jgi:hypothetical protein
MNYTNASRVMITLLLVVLASSFTVEPPAKKFTPVGTWEYSIPGVQPGYEKGSMIIAEDDKNYKVSMELNEYYQTDAENIIYKKKKISFSFFVETEEILVTGTFDGDDFSGSLSYFEGDFKITAKRNTE